jgi:C4-dicarboxylate-specific signal transduction histidine kinase
MILKGKTNLLRRLIIDENFDSAKLIEHIDRIDFVTERINNITKGMSLYSRSSNNVGMVSSKVEDIISSTLILCKERLDNELVDVKINLNKNLSIECYPSEIVRSR